MHNLYEQWRPDKRGRGRDTGRHKEKSKQSHQLQTGCCLPVLRVKSWGLLRGSCPYHHMEKSAWLKTAFTIAFVKLDQLRGQGKKSWWRKTLSCRACLGELLCPHLGSLGSSKLPWRRMHFFWWKSLCSGLSFEKRGDYMGLGSHSEQRYCKFLQTY